MFSRAKFHRRKSDTTLDIPPRTLCHECTINRLGKSSRRQGSSSDDKCTSCPPPKVHHDPPRPRFAPPCLGAVAGPLQAGLFSRTMTFCRPTRCLWCVLSWRTPVGLFPPLGPQGVFLGILVYQSSTHSHSQHRDRALAQLDLVGAWVVHDMANFW